MKKKSFGTFILILIILGLIGYIIYDKYNVKTSNNTKSNNIVNDKKEETKTEENKELVKKYDDNKDYVYDGEYKGDFSKESYTTDLNETYNSKDLKAPYFNIDSSDASNSNKEINETYLNAVRIFNQGVNDKSTYIKLSYKKYENDDIISAILKYEMGDIGVSNPIYYTYNFNKKDGKLLTFDESVSLAKIDNIDDKVKKAIKKELNKQMGDNPNVYPEGESIDTYVNKSYSGYEDNKKYNLIKYILNEKNELSVVVDINMPAEVSHLNTLINIK